jgi:hypothetical protein
VYAWVRHICEIYGENHNNGDVLWRQNKIDPNIRVCLIYEKNKGLDRTTSNVLCLILKLFLILDKLGPWTEQKLKFPSSTEPRDNFLSSVQVA